MTNKEFRAIRELARMSQGEVATYLELGRRQVQRYEEGTSNIPGPVSKLMRQLKDRYEKRLSQEPPLSNNG